ncbi:MAG: sporulation protein YunB [Ruminococcaceae bacterium]|nr:sporulation protein YunB [Oscillospiraceae bacterium]
MRLGEKKRICIKNNRINRKKVSGFLILLLFVSMIGTCIIYFLKSVQPLLLEMARNQTKVIAEQAVQRAVGKLFENISYTEFIKLSRLEDGTISALESDMMRVNQLKAEASIVIQKEIGEIDETEIKVPLGSVTGSVLFAGMGPDLPVTLVPYGRTEVEFKSEFTESGINQTHLEISLMAKSHVGIIMPTGRTAAEIVTELPVVQTVIVGKIPDNYVNIDRVGEEFEGDVMDLIN